MLKASKWRSLMLGGAALAAVIGLAGCGNDTGDVSESGARRVTTAMQASAVQTFRGDDTFSDNLWTRLIYDELGIEVDVVFSADNSTDAYSNQMNLLLVSGDLPDVLRHDNREWFHDAQQAGLLMDITDVFMEHASPGVLAFMERYPESFAGVSVDGRLYGFPFMNDNFHNASFLWLRDDWLEYAGGTPPQTVEELVEMALLFANGDPAGDGRQTFGLALGDIVTRNNVGSIGGLLAAFGVPNHNTQGVFYHAPDGTVTNSFIQPEVRYALEIMRDLYAAGAIDPEFMTKDVSRLETDFALGSQGMAFHMNWGTWHPFNHVYTEDGVIMRPYEIPRVPGIEPRHGIRNNSMTEYFVVSADAPHPEAIIEMINLYYEVAVAGSQEQFLTYWADEQYRLAPIFIGLPSENWAQYVIDALEAGSPDGLVGQALSFYDFVVGFENGTLADDANAFGTWGQMSEFGSMRIALDAKNRGELVEDIIAGYVPASWLNNQSILTDHVNINFVSFIRGARDLSEFDAFVQEWLDMGGQQVLDDLTAAYPQ